MTPPTPSVLELLLDRVGLRAVPERTHDDAGFQECGDALLFELGLERLGVFDRREHAQLHDEALARFGRQGCGRDGCCRAAGSVGLVEFGRWRGCASARVAAGALRRLGAGRRLRCRRHGGPLLDGRRRRRREGGGRLHCGRLRLGRPGLEWLGRRQCGDGWRLAGRSFRHDRPVAPGIVVQQSQAHDRRDDQGKRQGQPAHGALLELLLVASGGWFCHRFPRSLFLGRWSATVPPCCCGRQNTARAPRPVRLAGHSRGRADHSARRCCASGCLRLFLSPGRHAILMNFKDCEEAAAWQ